MLEADNRAMNRATLHKENRTEQTWINNAKKKNYPAAMQVLQVFSQYLPRACSVTQRTLTNQTHSSTHTVPRANKTLCESTVHSEEHRLYLIHIHWKQLRQNKHHKSAWHPNPSTGRFWTLPAEEHCVPLPSLSFPHCIPPSFLLPSG